MDTNTLDASQLEEHLLKHYVRADEEEAPHPIEGESQQSPFPSLDTSLRHLVSPLQKEIHFLYDEIQGQLNEEIEKVLFQIHHPLAGKQIGILHSFVRAVIHARAVQMQHIQEDEQHALEEEKLAVLAGGQEKNLVPLSIVPEEIGKIIPPAPLTARGPVFPEIPKEDEYELSALDVEEQKKKPDETTVQIIHIPLVLDDERNEIVAAADYNDLDGVYRLSEPDLDDRQRALLVQLKKDITDVNLLRSSRGFQKQIAKSARKIGAQTIDEDYSVLRYYLVRDLVYAGPVSALLNDQKITAVLCDGPGVQLMIIREGKKITTTVVFQSRDELHDFITRMAQRTFQQVTMEQPVLDAVYKNFRIQGTLGTEIVPSRFLMTRIAV